MVLLMELVGWVGRVVLLKWGMVGCVGDDVGGDGSVSGLMLMRVVVCSVGQ